MNDKYIPLRSGEATEIQLLWACREVLDTAEKQLEKRLRACYRWRQYRVMQKWLENMTNDIMLTIEPKKAKTFLVNLMNQEIRVVQREQAQVPGMQDQRVRAVDEVEVRA